MAKKYCTTRELLLQVTEIDFGKPKKKRNFLLKHWAAHNSEEKAG